MSHRLPLWPSLFVWTVVPMLLYGAYATHGLPHFIWSYVWRDEGQGYSPLVLRHYLSCTYVGPYGAFTEDAEGGRCGWVTFRKAPQHPTNH